MPVVELMPSGTVRAYFCVAASTSARRRAGLDPGGAHLGVDGDGVHRREVEEQRAVGDGEAGDLVAAAADGEEHAVLAGEVHRRLDVADVGGADDEAGAAVDHPVPDGARRVVAGVAGVEELAVERDVERVRDRRS